MSPFSTFRYRARLQDVAVHARESHDRIAEDGEDGVEGDDDDRRHDAEAQRDDQQADERERWDGQADCRHVVGEGGQCPIPVAQGGNADRDDGREDQTLHDQGQVLPARRQNLLPPF